VSPSPYEVSKVRGRGILNPSLISLYEREKEPPPFVKGDRGGFSSMPPTYLKYRGEFERGATPLILFPPFPSPILKGRGSGG